MDKSISYITLNIFKNYNYNNTFLSRILVNSLVSTNNLKKITSTRKKLASNSSYLPYLSYIYNNIEYKLYDIIKINKFLDNIQSTENNSNTIYNYMMESKI